MDKTIAKIINALAEHEDSDSVNVLEELGTNSPDSEVRELTAKALVRKNSYDSLKVVITNQGKGINDLSSAVAMSTVNEIISLEDKSIALKVLDDTIYSNPVENVRDNAASVKSLISLS